MGVRSAAVDLGGTVGSGLVDKIINSMVDSDFLELLREVFLRATVIAVGRERYNAKFTIIDFRQLLFCES